MDANRRTARWAGLWFIGTFIFSIPAALVLYHPILNDVNYVVGAGADSRIAFGASLEILTAISGVATAVVLYRVLRPVSESISLGYVATRIIESGIIIMGLISLLALITMRQDFASASGADRALYVTIGKSLVALHDRTFLIGPAFCAGIGNGIMLGYLMYRSALVPRNWAIFGMIAGAIALLTAVLVLFNAYEQQSSVSALLTAPEFVWEAFLGIYLTFHGFHQPSILDEAGPVSSATTTV